MLEFVCNEKPDIPHVFICFVAVLHKEFFRCQPQLCSCVDENLIRLMTSFFLLKAVKNYQPNHEWCLGHGLLLVSFLYSFQIVEK